MNPILHDYLPIAVLLLIAVFLAILLPVLSLILGPKRPSARQKTPYESGMTAIGEGAASITRKILSYRRIVHPL